MNPDVQRFHDAICRVAGNKKVPKPGDRFPDFYGVLADIIEDVEQRLGAQDAQLKIAQSAIEATLNFINGVSGSPKEVLNLNMEALKQMGELPGALKRSPTPIPMPSNGMPLKKKP